MPDLSFICDAATDCFIAAARPLWNSMIRHITRASRGALWPHRSFSVVDRSGISQTLATTRISSPFAGLSKQSQCSAFHTTVVCRAQSPTADALMENLNDLYATARDEFEIAAEETEKNTVYAADDRQAAQDALKLLKEAFEKAIKESDPEVAKEVQGRVGPRIRELENAVTAMEESAIEG